MRKLDEHGAAASHLMRLSSCLYVPIGARSLSSIEEYVGDVVDVLVADKAYLVSIHTPQPPNVQIPIWNHPNISVLHEPLQVWVQVDYQGYRPAFARAFPDREISDRVLDHVLNRRLARMKGFSYLRIVPVSRATNSSHGGLSEKWGVNHHAGDRQLRENEESKAQIQYADIADIAKMLDISGKGGFMEGVNTVHHLAKLPGSY